MNRTTALITATTVAATVVTTFAGGGTVTSNIHLKHGQVITGQGKTYDHAAGLQVLAEKFRYFKGHGWRRLSADEIAMLTESRHTDWSEGRDWTVCVATTKVTGTIVCPDGFATVFTSGRELQQ